MHWGDGWNGATVDITVNGTPVVTGATAAPGAGGGNLSTEDLLFAASTGDVIALSNWAVRFFLIVKFPGKLKMGMV